MSPWHSRFRSSGSSACGLLGWSWLVVFSICAPLCSPVAAGELAFDARLKWFGTATAFPEHDIQRQLDETPAYDQDLDLRLMFLKEWSAFALQVEHSTIFTSGDSLAFLSAPGTVLEQSPLDDSHRVMDLTWEIEDGGGHRSLHRLDRLALKFRAGNWGGTLGRQAISWGSGLVFQPMDLFNPFAPTTVDRDYKAGGDLLLVERLFGDGSDLQLLAVGRRDDNGDVTEQVASFAGKWRGFVGQGEVELLAAKHFTDQIYGVSLRFPVGGALLRSDVVGTHLDAAGWRVSFIVNADYSLDVAGRSTYVFAEYFHNSFGVDELPDSILELPQSLRDRLDRGELFNVMRDYLALGTNYEWHPLWSQNLTLIGNLHDGSTLVQTQVTYEPGDHQRLQFGAVKPLGSAGDEFGGVPLAIDLNSEPITTGGGLRGYVRWVYYF
jgi:hypothetical protein